MSSSTESSYKSGQNDANRGYGQKPENSFNNYRDREAYQAGYNQQKQNGNK